MSQSGAELPELAMSIQPKVIEHLGINMYTSFPPVISEIIANAWDADAKKVCMNIPDEPMSDTYEIIIHDNGTGMTYQELLDKYLQIGRNRRLERTNSEDGEFLEKTPVLGRRVLGRKGIGKLSVFGVAQKVTIKSVKDKKVTEFIMDVEEIKKETSGRYKPTPIRINEDTEEDNGVTVKLAKLKRKKSIDLGILKKGIARRFALLGNDFDISINDEKITREDIQVDDVEWRWDIDDIIQESPEWRVTGSIFTREGTVRDEESRGIAIFAGGKLVQEPTFFGATSGKEFAYHHMMGELNAEFLDEKNDVVSTNRSSINWETDEGRALSEWGKSKVIEISKIWAERRIAKRTEEMNKEPEFKKWIDDLSGIEKKRVMRVINAIIGNENLPKEKVVRLTNFVKDSYRYAAFQELADQINETNPENASLVVELFQEWEHLEAKEMYRIMEGRISTIEKLKWYIEHNEREKEIQNYLKKFPWIMDPRWTRIQDEVRYSDLLRKKFPDNEGDRRIDFLCFGSWPNAIVVELKRPGVAVGAKELDQIRDYVIFIEGLIGTDPDFSYKKVTGYLMCEDIQKSSENARRIEKLEENGIFVRKYSELLSVAEGIHEDMIEKYKELARITKS